MQKRERILAMVAGALLLMAAVHYLYGRIRASFDERHLRIGALRTDLERKQGLAARGRKFARQLKEYERRSLPSNLELARSQYQHWLSSLVDNAKLANADVSSSSVSPRRGVYDKLPFTVRGHGDAKQITSLLYDFYAADHLHQVRRITLAPVDAGAGKSNSGQVNVLMTIEALVLPGADRRDKLNLSPSKRLARGDLVKYHDTIAGRNLFAPYTPPPPPVVQAAPEPTPPAPPPFDPAKHAYVTAVLDVGGRPQVWLNVRTTGELIKLNEGDTFQVGGFQGKIAKIEARAIEFEAEGRRHRVRLGKNLRDSTEVAATAGV